MPVTQISIVATAALALTVSLAQAQDAHRGAINARQGQMDIMAFNVGILGAMAKGEREYDADAANAAAGNILAITTLDQSEVWPAGSSADEAENTRALAPIWSDTATFTQRWQQLGTAVEALQAAAGGGVDGLRPAMGQVGQVCGGCHETFRAKN